MKIKISRYADRDSWLAAEETWRWRHTLMLDVADKAMRKAKTEDPRFTRAYLIVRDLMIEAILRD